MYHENAFSSPPTVPEQTGWFVSHAEGSMDNRFGTRVWQLQRDDEMSKFDSDVAAWRAMLSSDYADDVLAFLRVHSPAEYGDIMEIAENQT